MGEKWKIHGFLQNFDQIQQFLDQSLAASAGFWTKKIQELICLTYWNCLVSDIIGKSGLLTQSSEAQISLSQVPIISTIVWWFQMIFPSFLVPRSNCFHGRGTRPPREWSCFCGTQVHHAQSRRPQGNSRLGEVQIKKWRDFHPKLLKKKNVSGPKKMPILFFVSRPKKSILAMPPGRVLGVRNSRDAVGWDTQKFPDLRTAVMLPSGKSSFLMGKSTINGHFQ